MIRSARHGRHASAARADLLRPHGAAAGAAPRLRHHQGRRGDVRRAGAPPRRDALRGARTPGERGLRGARPGGEARAARRAATTASLRPASRCSRTRAGGSPTTRSSSATGCGTRGRARHERLRRHARARRPAGGRALPRAAATRSWRRRARPAATGGRCTRLAELASLVRLALQPARPSASARTVWLQGALLGTLLVAVTLFAPATPLVLAVPFVLLILGLADARLAAAATVFWLWRLRHRRPRRRDRRARRRFGHRAARALAGDADRDRRRRARHARVDPARRGALGQTPR